MATIHVLPETVQNKIAAGEVIERPASAVKELVENSLDAGARHVAVELEEGGHRLIRVSDDGGGMDEADLVACLQRHATSKIRDVDDIFRIATFGFRGEALPSIGAVSRLSIATCLPGAPEGREIFVEAGKIVRLSPAPPRRGTRVEVRDIFFNTPARRKFLRPPPSEVTHATEMLTRLALGNPEAGFRMQAGDRLVAAFQPAASQPERLREVFGDRACDRLVPFGNEITDGLRVSGFFARPPESRRNSKDIYIFVNRRWIRYYGLARAVGDAFAGILPPREYPFAIVNLEVDPARVDVNAHPAKEEVRFEQEKLLIAGVRRALREALGGVAAAPTAEHVSFGRGAEERAAPAASPGAAAAANPQPAPPPARRDGGGGDGGGQKALSMPGSFARRSGGGDFSGLDLARARELLRPIGRREPPAPERAAGEEEAPAPALDLGAAGRHRVLGQAGGKYIIVDGPDGLLLVDPHALHERWNFDRLVEERRRGGAAEKLLLPLELRLTPAESAAAVEAVPALAEYGFEFELRGANILRVTAAPPFLPSSKMEVLLRQVLADAGEAEEALEGARDRLLASLACRSAVLLGKTLPEEEMLALLDRFFNRGQMPTCPHGRPTAIRIGWDELARRFGR